MFTCPNCQNPLTQAQSKVGIYWACSNCGGRAANLAVLRKAAAPDFVNRIWALAREGKGIEGRHCPTCNLPMMEVTLPASPNALKLDVCKRCEVVWFDSGELESTPAATPKPSTLDDEKNLPQKAREALALYKVQRIAEDARKEEESAQYAGEFESILATLFNLPL